MPARFGESPGALDPVHGGVSTAELILVVIHTERLAVADLPQAIVGRQAYESITLSRPTWPRFRACSVALEPSGTISVETQPRGLNRRLPGEDEIDTVTVRQGVATHGQECVGVGAPDRSWRNGAGP